MQGISWLEKLLKLRARKGHGMSSQKFLMRQFFLEPNTLLWANYLQIINLKTRPEDDSMVSAFNLRLRLPK